MRIVSGVMLLIFSINTAQCQIKLSGKDFKLALPAAEIYLLKIFGKRNFDRNIKVDTEFSRNYVQVDYDKKYKSSGVTHFVNNRELFFWVIDAKDTIGSFTVLIDSNHNIYDEGNKIDFAATNAPALLMGYNKLLSGEMKIRFKQACALGKKYGFKLSPMFQVYLGSTYIFKEGKVFVNAKYVWGFSERDETGGYNRLDLNAESGKIEKEEYVKPMPQ